ncbi:GatB/YqeY domain-containing protein [Candidatus Dojkabacteria bacterium]|nr:GatB/YqeY domain-containing protein [Candidatus Dojkabacteria bacterium]
MSLLQEIQKESILAMKEKNTVKQDILKLLIAALKNAQIAKPGGKELTKEEEVKVIFSESKKIKDSIEKFKEAGREDLLNREEEQLGYVEKYLPAQAGEDDIIKVVEKAIKEVDASGMGDMGRVMGLVMKELQGKADGAVVNRIVKSKLSE